MLKCRFTPNYISWMIVIRCHIFRPERRSWWLQERCQSLLECSLQRWTCGKDEVTYGLWKSRAGFSFFLILRFSEINQFSSSLTGCLMFCFFHVLCILEASSFTRSCSSTSASLSVSDSLWETALDSATMAVWVTKAVLNLDRAHTVCLYNIMKTTVNTQ